MTTDEINARLAVLFEAQIEEAWDEHGESDVLFYNAKDVVQKDGKVRFSMEDGTVVEITVIQM